MIVTRSRELHHTKECQYELRWAQSSLSCSQWLHRRSYILFLVARVGTELEYTCQLYIIIFSRFHSHDVGAWRSGLSSRTYRVRGLFFRGLFLFSSNFEVYGCCPDAFSFWLFHRSFLKFVSLCPRATFYYTLLPDSRVECLFSNPPKLSTLFNLDSLYLKPISF